MKKVLIYFMATVLTVVCCACTPNQSSNGTNEEYESVYEEIIYENLNSTTTSFDDTASADDEQDQTSSVKETSGCSHLFAEATCTRPQICKKCKKVQGEPLGHDFADATCQNPKTCVRCKKVRGATKGHTYAKATCTQAKTCTKCNAVQGKALGHTFTKATCTQAKICTECNFVESEALGHSYAAATCTLPKICTTCGVTQGKALGHNYAAATCTQPKTCTKCKATQGDTIAHNYVTGECTVCGDYNKSYCAKLYFTGDMSGMNSKKDVRNITYEYRSKGQVIKGAAKIKPQGSSSLGYAKKNYTINLYSDTQYAQKQTINVGWGNQSEYCLKANWIDKTHSRNIVTAKLAAQVQKKYGLFNAAPNNGTVDGFPVEIYINGSFHGLYTMNIPKSAWMFGMDENNPNHIVLCGENWTGPVLFKEFPNNFDYWSVEVGPENDATLQKIKDLIAFVRDSSDEDFKANFEKHLNLDATLNYYVLMHYGWMPDNVGKNMLLVTYDGKVWYPSLYDLDTTWGTDWKGQNLYDYKNGEMQTETSVLWTRFEKLYSKEIAARYFELRSSVLDTNNVMDMFNSFYNSIPKEVIERETVKWGSNIPGYDISQIRDYLDTFIPRLDEKFKTWK